MMNITTEILYRVMLKLKGRITAVQRMDNQRYVIYYTYKSSLGCIWCGRVLSSPSNFFVHNTNKIDLDPKIVGKNGSKPNYDIKYFCWKSPQN